MTTLNEWALKLIKGADINECCALITMVSELIRQKSSFEIKLSNSDEKFCLFGIVHGHVRLTDGHYIETSPVKAIRGEAFENIFRLIINTANTEYVLKTDETDDLTKLMLRTF